MKKFLLFILFLGLVYASQAQNNPREHLLDQRHEHPELTKLKHREFQKQQIKQEHLRELQLLKAQNENQLKNTKGLKNNLTVAMNADDRAILETFYNATNGANWSNNTNWLTGNGSNWYGISLDANGKVTQINLQNNQLNGSIPAELGNLTNLQWLYLNGNQLSGSIPAELGNLTNLQTLYLYNNQLSGSIPTELGDLTNLQWLHLGNNQLSGSIPAELGNLTNLYYLFLYNNQLSDSIPTELGNLANLQYLQLSNNQLSGSIPVELGNLANLQYLGLYSNQLSGSIPAELGNLTNLRYLYLSNNQFTSLPVLSTLVNLASWGTAVQNNSLDFGELENSGISWNSYSPQAKVPMTRNENGGNITFTVSVGGTNNAYKWYKNNVEISGETANSLTIANSNSAEGIYFCKITNPGFSNLVLTSIADGVGVSLTNGIITNEYNALIALYNATNGDNWTNHTNWKTTEPVDAWYGVSVSGGHIIELNLNSNQLSGTIPSELGNLTNLQWLYLYSNQLSGSIPTELENLTNLQLLYLDNNQLSGSIPAELGNLTNLRYLDLDNNQLSGSIPAEFGNLTYLYYLNLNNNQLSGSIPAEFGNLTNLRYLYLNNNQFSGSIPTAIGNLTNLYYSYLNNNQLSGSIPAEFGNLTNLRYLYLNNNQLSGSIPTAIGNLTNIQRLYLNNNQLSGSIPTELGNLTNLQSLYLSNNQLSGSIPTELGNLTNLQSLYLNDNQLTSLPDLSTLVNLNPSSTGVENNSLDFGDLESSGIHWYSYAPQANVPMSRNENSGNITFTVSVAGTNNGYKWYKNDVEISGETTNSLIVANTAEGIYYCKITNTLYPSLVLTSVADGVGSVSLTNGVMTNEYDALIALYNATNGDNWNNNTKWPGSTNLKITEPVDSWQGINVSGAHITEINLSNNNLSGSIPAELGNLTNLQKLNLSSNQLTSLPDLSTLVNLSSTAIDNNLLDFGDLETSSINWNSYAPQAKVGTEQNIKILKGKNKNISVNVDGTNNSYQWYKDGTAISGATNSKYTISHFNGTTDRGVYVCKIKDNNYPSLTLETNNITVSKGTATAIDTKDDSQFSIYPNPVSDRLIIHFSKEKVGMLKVFDLTGKQLLNRKVNSEAASVNLSNLKNGIYILQFKFKNQIISKKIIKN